MRVLVLAPVGRDAQLLKNTLEREGIDTAIAANATELLELLKEDAGAAIVAEEALTAADINALASWSVSQPPWSDPPFIVLTSSGSPSLENARRAAQLETIGNVTLVERPARPETVESAIRAALRARTRQYEMRSRQEALLRANADLEQFAYSASHDLREPIRTISVYTELVSRRYGHLLDEKGLDFLNLANSSAQRMEVLLNDLLSYARASNIPDNIPDAICAGEPLRAALANLTAAVQESGAQITVGEMPFVRIRPSHLEQLFQNLIGNALKYRGEERPQVRITAREQERAWLFCVEDNGIGIPPEYRETIFGIFKRLHSKQSYDGTGMGLAICQRIVERYRGRIWVESGAGQGSRFCFTVPL